MHSPTVIQTSGRPTPYITIGELTQSPVYTQLRALVPGQSDQDRDAELARIIMRASSMINGEVNQNLAASADLEVGEVSVLPTGDLRIKTRCDPIIEVTSLSIGPSLSNLTPVSDLSNLLIYPWSFILPSASSDPTLNLPSASMLPGGRLWAQWSYINGYPTTTLASPTAVGDTTMTVADATGIQANDSMLTVQDGKFLEQITPTAVSGNVLTVAPLLYAHQAGVGVTELPDAVKEATFLLISRLHDTWSLTMNAVSTDATGARKNETPPRIMCQAAEILAPYRRLW